MIIVCMHVVILNPIYVAAANLSVSLVANNLRIAIVCFTITYNFLTLSVLLLAEHYMVAWKHGIAILSAGTVKVSPDPRISIVNGYSLEIKEAGPHDAGDYVCQIATMTPREITHTVEILSEYSVLLCSIWKMRKYIILPNVCGDFTARTVWKWGNKRDAFTALSITVFTTNKHFKPFDYYEAVKGDMDFRRLFALLMQIQ